MSVGTGNKAGSSVGGSESGSGTTQVNVNATVKEEDMQFIQISPETVELVAETVGITNLDPTAAVALSEDATYRCREVANICGQLLRHAKRRKLTTKDVNEAFDLYDTDPVLGHGGSDGSTYTMLKENAPNEYENLNILYVPDEKLIDLRTLALAPTPPIVASDACIQATWLSVEGHFYPENEEAKPVDFPQQAHVTPALMQYYSTVISVTLGDSEEMMSRITKDLEVNTKIGTLLPFIVNFIRNGMQKHCENKVLMRRLLCLLQALFSNSALNLSPKPYLSHLVTALLSSLIVDRPGQQSHHYQQQMNGCLNVDHVQHASRILRQVLDRWSTPVNQLRSQTHRALRDYLKEDKISYSSHFGALSAMIALGPDVLEDCLLPQLEKYIQRTREKMQKAEEEQLAAVASFNLKDAGFYESAKKKITLNLIWGTLIAAARCLISYYYTNAKSIALSDKYVTSQINQEKEKSAKVKDERGEGLEEPLDAIDKISFIEPNGQINLVKLYFFLREQFGSSLSNIKGELGHIIHSNKLKRKEKRFPLVGSRFSGPRLGARSVFHAKFSRNPLDCVGRLRIRTIGRRIATINENVIDNGLDVIKKETEDMSYPSSNQMDLKNFMDEKINHNTRPTSSASSDADFNYLAGCGLPSDIFEPMSSSAISLPSSSSYIHGDIDNLENVVKIKNEFPKKDSKSMLEDEESSVELSQSVIDKFELLSQNTDCLDTNGASTPIKTISRHSNITFAFGTSQWSRKTLRRKRFTPAIGCRFKNNTTDELTSNFESKKGRVVVGKRMGTPRKITSNFIAVENSCCISTTI